MCGRNIGAIFSGPRLCLCPPSPAGSTLRPTAAPYGSPPTAICPPRVMPGCASPACGAVHPSRPLRLETLQPSSPRTAEIQRVVDLICPLGFGQRALIVSPPKAGKTVMLQAVAEGVALNHPAAVLLILLVDERPEEVSEMVDWGRGEVIASSFDLSHERHVAVADMVFEHARRQVELGRDVVIVLDSLTRLARSHNTTGRGTGRTMSGGLDANALAKPKGLFGAARAVPPK